MDHIYKQPVLDAKFAALTMATKELAAVNDELKAAQNPSAGSMDIAGSIGAMIKAAIDPLRAEMSADKAKTAALMAEASERIDNLKERLKATNKFWSHCSTLTPRSNGTSKTFVSNPHQWMTDNQGLVMQHIINNTFSLNVNSSITTATLVYENDYDRLLFVLKIDHSPHYILSVNCTIGGKQINLLGNSPGLKFSEKLAEVCWARVEHLRKFPDSTVSFEDTLRVHGLI